MTAKKLLLRAMAVAAALAALYALLAMLTQAMLGGHSAEQIWWDRVYAWWVDFLGAGMLSLLAVYLWRKSTTEGRPRPILRVVLFPLAHVFLTGCLYFADLAAYARKEGGSRTVSYIAIAIVSVAASVVTLRFAGARKT